MLNQNDRNLNIDLIKVCAILGVIVIHICSSVLTEETIGTFDWISALSYGTLFRASVPLFLMASGAILLNPDKPLSIKKLYLHNIARIIVAMLFWGLGYKIFHLYMDGNLNADTVWYSAKRLLLFDHEFHFYYIDMILIVYIFLPITRLFVEKADKKLLKYSLLIWMILAIIYPTLRYFKPFSMLSGLTGQWAINLTFSSIGYGVLGYYLSKYKPSIYAGIIAFYSGITITFGATYYLSQNDGVLNEIFLAGTSPGVMLLAIGVFVLMQYVKIRGFFERIITYISKASFCIYLSHMFILYILGRYSITALIFAPVLSVPILSIIVFLVCLAVYTIISKIPILKKWII